MRADKLTWSEHMRSVSEYLMHLKPISSAAVWKARAERLTRAQNRAYTPSPK